MKLRFKYGVGRWIMCRFRGKVLYPFILFKPEKEDVTDRLFRHELEHVYQVRRMGWIPFYIKYLWLGYKHGYARHPFEVEARARQHDQMTQLEREWKDHGDLGTRSRFARRT